MDNPLVSIIIPIYNVADYLPKCINSVLAQTFTNFELILVDDGSLDNSGRICDDYALKDSRIRVFHNQNMGAGAARKFGVLQAKGDWIMFVDSDDTITSQCIELLYQHHLKADIIVGTINLNGKQVFKHQVEGLLSQKKYIESLLLGKTSIGPVAKLIRRDKFDAKRWIDDKRITINEDLLMLIVLATECDSIYVDPSIICYNYLFREGSARGNKTELKMWESLFSLIERSIKPVFNNSIPSFFYIFCIRRLFDSLIMRGSFISPEDVKFQALLSNCKRYNISANDKTISIICSSLFLQKLSYKIPFFYSMFRRFIKVIHY